jgi:hypothetical protein
MRLEMARPAASSDAEFIRWPVESRSIAWLIARSFFESAFAVTVAAVFVLITVIVTLRYSVSSLIISTAQELIAPAD